jgi:hypothetical protein
MPNPFVPRFRGHDRRSAGLDLPVNQIVHETEPLDHRRRNNERVEVVHAHGAAHKATAAAFKQVVLAARTVSARSRGGIWLVKDLFPRLGIAGKVDVKITPRGTGAAGMIADGGASVAVLPISEILTANGVDYASRLEHHMLASFTTLAYAFWAAVLPVGATELVAVGYISLDRCFVQVETGESTIKVIDGHDILIEIVRGRRSRFFAFFYSESAVRLTRGERLGRPTFLKTLVRESGWPRGDDNGRCSASV